MDTLDTHLVGANFRPQHSKDAVRNLEEGDELLLVAEPENPYDSNAVKVCIDDLHLGYIPRTDNEELSAALQAGQAFTCVVTATESLKPSLRISHVTD